MTAYNGTAITYDTIGNPTSYYNGWSFTWEHGREMATATNGTQSLSFTYDAEGLRTTKTVNGVVYTYYYSGGKLMRLTYGDYVLDFFYDQNGHPFMLLQNGNVYYYVTNAQGDVIRLVDINGNTAASYRYDPYGKAISALGSHATINPLRYRGYVYDHETGLYYLQSRYYDPEIGRFINADVYASTGQGLLGYNMFAYCNNNPVNCSDETGYFTDGQIHDFVVKHIAMLEMLSGRDLKYQRWDTLIVYDFIWKGKMIGFCDLFDPNTGEMWEVKKNSTSYYCSDFYARRQLDNYINNGHLARYPDLKPSWPQTVIPEGRFSKYDNLGNEYVIRYWDEGNGIIRYSYYINPSRVTVAALAFATAGAIYGMTHSITSRNVATATK